METSTAAFLTKEKDLYGKIEELQARLEELGQHSPDFSQHIMKEVCGICNSCSSPQHVFKFTYAWSLLELFPSM